MGNAGRNVRTAVILLTAAGLAALALRSEPRPRINPDLLKYPWKAQWIEHAAGPYRDFGVFHFRKTFHLERVPGSFVVHVSADNRYRLFVNGISVSIGPARSDLDHYRYETVDIAPQLKPGRNVLAAVVWNFGIYAPMAQHIYRAGFLLQGEGDAGQMVNTGGSTSGWKSIHNRAYQPIPMTYDIIPDFYAVGPGERIDASQYPWGWERPDFDDSQWAPPGVIGPAQPMELFEWNLTRWLLTPRPIPPMEETPQRLARVVRSSGVAVPPSFVKGGAVFAIAANARATILLDQGELTNAYPELAVSGGKGATFKLTYAESLRDAQDRKGNRNETEGKHIRGNFDIFTLDGGHRIFRTLFWRCYRYIQLDIETREDPLTVEDLRGYYSSYPVERRAAFESPDKELAKILQIGWRTHRLCQNETYFDTPQYEQLAYAGDGRLEALISLTNMWDDRIVRNHIELFWYSLQPEGMIQDRYPSREPQYLPSYGLDWVRSLHDFWMYRDDPDFLRKFLPASRSILDWYARRLDDKHLLRRLSWTDERYEGPQEFPENGPEARNQLEFILALEDAAELEAALGRPEVAERYRTLVPLLRKAALDTFWLPERGLLARNRDRKDVDQHSNVLGVLAGVIPPPYWKSALLYTTTHFEELPRVQQEKSTFFFFWFRHEAMDKAGLGDEFIRLLDPWRKQVAAGFSTWGESAEIELRSDSHDWSSAPNVQVFTIIAGIRPAAPGFRKVAIRPHLNGLPWVKATAPHPQGEITVSLKAVGDHGIEAEVTLPETLSGWFEWRGEKVPLHGGPQKLRF
jgi:alpha-L-rhamnosidase